MICRHSMMPWKPHAQVRTSPGGVGGDTTLVANDTLCNRPMDGWTAGGSTGRKVGNGVRTGASARRCW
ncbi:hypothetical protein [Streptomyces sp. NPDC086023]|uniref:hypothetical protein n=1 Tax=Streptomyces sp. NPDC086023 TaxID=3365746 RepID=UPI0037D1421D